MKGWIGDSHRSADDQISFVGSISKPKPRFWQPTCRIYTDMSPLVWGHWIHHIKHPLKNIQEHTCLTSPTALLVLSLILSVTRTSHYPLRCRLQSVSDMTSTASITEERLNCEKSNLLLQSTLSLFFRSIPLSLSVSLGILLTLDWL